jgi:hypothetical protein
MGISGINQTQPPKVTGKIRILLDSQKILRVGVVDYPYQVIVRPARLLVDLFQQNLDGCGLEQGGLLTGQR